MKSEYGITGKKTAGGRNVITIDTKKANYQGQKWYGLSDFQKRKFENLVFLNNAKDNPVVRYE